MDQPKLKHVYEEINSSFWIQVFNSSLIVKLNKSNDSMNGK